MKKLIKYLCFFALAFLLVSSCYSAWLESFANATRVYEDDKEFCKTHDLEDMVGNVSFCLREVEEAYDAAIWDAATIFNHCD